MFDSFAHLLSDAYQALGFPDKEHLDPEDLTRAAFQSLAFFGLDSQQSEFGRTSKSVPLLATGREFALISAPDMLMPAYIERKMGNEPNETWDFVPLVRNSVVEEWRARGFAAGTLFREEDGYRVTLSYNPDGTEHRLRYYTDPTTVASRDDPLPIPSRYGFMLSHKTVVNAVPMMIMRSSNLPEEQQLNSAQLSALGVAVSHAQSQLKEWEPLWQKEKTADRSVRGRFRKPLVPRGW